MHDTRPVGEGPPRTEGKVIHWARFYDAATWLMSFGRASAIRRKTVELADIGDGERVLDVGCGTGTLTLAAKRVAGLSGHVSGIDASPEMIEVAREKAAKKGLKVDFQVGLIEDVPFADDHFDVVLSSLMLHHLPDDLKRKGFAEVRRVLKPGGRLFAVDLSGRAGLVGHIMALFGHGLDEGYIERLKAMAREAGLAEVESGPLDVGLAYVKGIAPKA